MGKDTDRGIVRALKDHMWFNPADSLNIQNKYGFKYFGELLERHEDKIGAEVCHLRAIALALAFTRELVTDDMFVGNQRINFIRKIERLSKDDTYLKGALYLLYEREERGDKLRAELIHAEYRNTEETLFILTLFENFEEALEAIKPQLLRLLGPERSMSVIHNARLFAWLIKMVSPILKKNRKKDMALFRALAKLPVSFVKEGNTAYSALLESGYSFDEIAYANYSLLLYRPVRETLLLDSITAERIAAQFTKIFINSADTHSEHTYDFLEKVLRRYEEFSIKYEGHKGLVDAIHYDIKLTNPKTFAWFYNLCVTRAESVFHFEIMAEKWDSLPQLLEPKDYTVLFENQLLEYSNCTAEFISKCISKYDTLTGIHYMDAFKKHDWYHDRVFSLLVKKGIIDLIEIFTESANQADGDKSRTEPTGVLKYISEFIKEVTTREAFEFFRFFFGKYDYSNLKTFFGARFSFSENIFNGFSNSYSSRKPLTLKRDFLSDEEHRQFLGWLDDCIFGDSVSQYVEFTICVLDDDFISTIMPKSELRKIYDSICKIESSVLKGHRRQIKEKLLTEDELAAEKEAELARKEDEKRQEAIRQHQEVADNFKTKYDGSFSSLFAFQNGFKSYWQSENRDTAFKMVKETVDDLLCGESLAFPKSEIQSFLNLGSVMLKNNAITFNEYKSYILKIEEDETNARDAVQDEFDPYDE